MDDNELKQILKYLKLDLKRLKLTRCDPQFLESYTTLVEYLYNLSLEERNNLYARKTTKINNNVEENRNEEEGIINLTLEQVEEMLSDNRTVRKKLEKIAKLKFNMTNGEIASTTSKYKLIEKMRTYINNIRTHESIKRQASGSNSEKKNE